LIFYKKKAKASFLKKLTFAFFSKIKNNNNRLIINQLRRFSKHHLPHRLRIARRVFNRNHHIIIPAHEVDCGDKIARGGVKLERAERRAVHRHRDLRAVGEACCFGDNCGAGLNFFIFEPKLHFLF
jgi:hypothetical protein